MFRTYMQINEPYRIAFKKYLLILIMAFWALLTWSCVSVQAPPAPQEIIEKEAAAVTDRISEINSALPGTVRCNVSVSGIMEGQPFKADGTLFMSREPQRARIQLKDPIFLAPALEIYADSKTIKFYFPAEKIARVAYGNFTDIDLSGRSDTRYLIAWMFSGEVPLIKEYSVKSVIHEGNKTTVVISNERVEQTIIMRDGAPYQITLVNSKTRLHYRVRYGAMYQDNNGRNFFRSISAYSRTTGDRVNTSYSRVRFDRPIGGSEFRLTIPSDARIIK